MFFKLISAGEGQPGGAELASDGKEAERARPAAGGTHRAPRWRQRVM